MSKRQTTTTCPRCGGGGSVIGYRNVRTQCPECWGDGTVATGPAPTPRFRVVNRKTKRGERGR